MPVAKKNSNSGIEWASGEKSAELLDARAQRVLGITGKEFLARWKAGRFKNVDSDECAGIIDLALLAPKSVVEQRSKKCYPVK